MPRIVPGTECMWNKHHFFPSFLLSSSFTEFLEPLDTRHHSRPLVSEGVEPPSTPSTQYWGAREVEKTVHILKEFII